MAAHWQAASYDVIILGLFVILSPFRWTFCTVYFVCAEWQYLTWLSTRDTPSTNEKLENMINCQGQTNSIVRRFQP